MTQLGDTLASGLDWPGRLEFQNRLRQAVLSREPTGEDGRDLAMVDFARIALMTALPRQGADLGEAVCEAAAAGAAGMLCCVMAEGHVVMEWPDHSVRRLPGPAMALDPTCWLRSLACALAARDEEAGSVLSEPSQIAAAQKPAHLADDFWPFLCAAVAAVVREPAATPAWLDDAERLLAPANVSKADPLTVRLKLQPFAAMVRALAAPDGDFDAALAHALAAYRELYSRREPSADPAQLLNLEALGLAALAFDRHRPFDRSALPASLVTGDFPRQPVMVTFEFAPRATHRPDDPIRILDLDGFPRSGRSHTLVQRDDKLLALYTLSGKAGCPRARATFVLEGGNGKTPAALDAGELILLADLYAHEAEAPLAAGESQAAAARLSEAVSAIDAVLSMIVPPDDAVPQSAFFTERGRRAREREPGRFRRDRLAAYRAALQQRQDELRASAPAASRGFALLTSEALAEEIKPLLAALAKDRSGAALEQVRPHPGDYAKVFQADALDAARRVYETLWSGTWETQFPASAQSELRVVVAPAGLLATANELSRQFPQGYTAIARILQPHRIWAAWKFAKPGEASGLAFDGLVWCDDHWAWFPKPYRHLRDCLAP